MKTKYHIDITRKALINHFSEYALETIIKANTKQDRLRLQFGHDYIHFVRSAFEQGFRYINDQKQILFEQLDRKNIDPT